MHIWSSNFSRIYGEPQQQKLLFSGISYPGQNILDFLTCKSYPDLGTCISPIAVNQNRGILKLSKIKHREKLKVSFGLYFILNFYNFIFLNDDDIVNFYCMYTQTIKYRKIFLSLGIGSKYT
jgi:hypothetical protein